MAYTQKTESVPVLIRLAAVALLLPALAMNGVKAQVSEELFMDPPIEARPNTYWEWMNGNISKEGLTKDLEYMKQANYGAAMIFEAGVGIPKGAVDCNTPLWKEMITHAVKEASRLGLKLGMHNAPGYSGTGGPWIPVEHSMKQLVWTESFAVSDGTKNVDIVLPRPFSKSDFYRDAYILAYPSLPHEGKCFSDVVARMTLDGKEMEHHILSDNDLTTQIRMEKGQYLLFELNEDFDMQSVTVFRGEREQPLDPHDGPRDYAPSLSVEVSQDNVHFVKTGNVDCPPLRAMDVPGILTFSPVKVRYVRLTSNRGTNLAEIDFHSSPRLNNYTAKTNCVNAAVGLEENRQEVSSTDIIPSDEVVDLTGKIDPNGHLAWNAPKGKWTIVRIGYTTTGETVAAAPDAGSGLDCDKFSKEALDVHFDRFLDPLLDSLKPYCGTVLEVLAIDSWEAGKQNWTEKLPAYFMQKRGYDIMPWMLAVTGRIVDSVGETERFLWDFRRTHTDMFLDNYVRHFKERISRYGLKYAGEAYGDGNFESLEMAAEQDIPMSEFWTHYIYGNIATTMMAASTAHVWDKKVVACECYTGTPFNSKFTEHPYGMKALGDYIMTAGVNRFVYHATTHQPYTGDQPGNIMTMGPFGTHLDRTSTWASLFSALNLYNSRCAYMLQQGQYVADILYIKNEAISSGVNNYNTAYPATPFGYRWDIAGKEALLNLSFMDGFFTLPHGMKYRLLVMTPMERTSPEVLEQVIKLVSLGGKVLLVGGKASGYLGLNSEKDREVRRLAEILWGSSTLGKGRIYHACDLAEVLKEEHISPDFSFTSRNKDARIHFIHRSAGNDDVYFIANHLRRPEELTVSCRVSGKVPYLWNAENGETGIPVPYEEKDGNIRFNLDLEESGSIFVVFRTGEGAPSDLQTVEPVPASVHTMQGDKPYSDDLDFHSTFSLSLWAKPETFAAGGRGYLVYPGTGTGNDARTGIAMGQNGVRIVERDEKTLRTVLEYTNPIEGWTHVGLVYKEGVPLLYLNGALVAQGKKSENNCDPSADVPMAEEQFIGSFEGDRTEPEIYDYALTEEQIKEKAESGLPHPRVKGTIWKDFSSDWKVGFPAWSKIGKEIELPALQSLHKHSDFNVSHFSGTAVYEKKIMIRKDDWSFLKDKRLLLNLGRVENMAEVSVNGSDFLPVWKAPYACDVTGLLKEGENDIRIRVTNLYPNRIIGDEHLPERYDYDEYGRIRSLPNWYLKGETDARERVLFLPWKYYKATDPLLESGLLGPVCLAYMNL